MNQGAYGKANLKRFASDLGLDRKAFDACLDSGRYTKKVKDETEEAQKKGARATPTFFIDGVKVEGAQPFATFQAVLERALQR